MTKTYVIYLKRKLRTYKIQIQVEKVWFVTKKWKSLILKFFFSKGGPFDVGTVEIFFSRFSKFQNYFLKNGFNGTWQMLRETKSWNLGLFRASAAESREIIYQGGICYLAWIFYLGTFRSLESSRNLKNLKNLYHQRLQNSFSKTVTFLFSKCCYTANYYILATTY